MFTTLDAIGFGAWATAWPFEFHSTVLRNIPAFTSYITRCGTPCLVVPMLTRYSVAAMVPPTGVTFTQSSTSGSRHATVTGAAATLETPQTPLPSFVIATI